ncbi:MAG: 50S ribosomal protein L6 [Phycisphaerae bacterium]
MSRIGRKPVQVPEAVKIGVSNGAVDVSGPKGQLRWTAPECVGIEWSAADRQVRIERKGDGKFARAMHGTARALIQNMVLGVTDGYRRGLEIYGTGYGAKLEGGKLVLNVGFAHAVHLPIPAGVQVDIEVSQTRGNETPAKFTLNGIDKQVVGQFARSIHDVRPPEPYQGKGIRYAGEQIRRKQGKAFAAGGG